MTTDIPTLEAQVRDSQETCDRLLEDIANIKDQIDRASAKARQTGDYSDNDWFHSAKRALRHKQAEHQRTLREAAELRRCLKALKQVSGDPAGRTFERQFMIEAKAVLSGELYGAIIARTQSNLSEEAK